ncbi:MAG: DUF2334 domain-containing protein [Fibrobacter sp.]|jgi:predicted deacetylase|nr:DUF2334 domain-containing protein [Fibrobacter sp.]
MKPERKILLAMHDVGILHFDKAKFLIEKLFRITGKPFSLLVIPHLGNATEEEKQAFTQQLKDWEKRGFEFLLHGYAHTADPDQARTFRGKLALKLTGGEAEFAGLSEADSRAPLEHARNAWEKLGLGKPAGFVPPTWHANSFLKNQVLENYEWYEDRFFLYSKEKKIFSPAVSFAGIPRHALALAAIYWKACVHLPFRLPRLALHPADLELLGETLFEKVTAVLKTGEPVFYREINAARTKP